MVSEFILSVVDQSPLRHGGTAAEALHETVAMAQDAESFGYERYWVTEHHNSVGLAGTAPEILIGQIAAKTARIRVGSAGVMLMHYSALKVAETFRLLSAFYPGRIDLGLGRAPGTDQRTAAALVHPKPMTDVHQFPNQVADLLGFINETLPEDHPYAGIRAGSGPLPDGLPSVWLLGSSDYSAQLAAVMGLPFAFADFFGYAGDEGPSIGELYRSKFRPSAYLSEPSFNVTLQVTCADTDEAARYIGSSRRLHVARTRSGDRRRAMEPPEEAIELVNDPEIGPVIASHTKHFIEGGPDTVKQLVEEAADRYGTKDVGIATHCYRLEDRVHSYRLIADVFGLPAAD